MARPVRANVAGGWYHITSRGNNRARIYCDRRDYEHFLELVKRMHEMFRVQVYAYVCMENHYHLLIRTPDANASRAIQWLNVSYSVWFNRRRGYTGHVFQGRFKGIVVEGGEWGLELSVYMHLNPVATKKMGAGKAEKKAAREGLSSEPTKEQVERRLEELRRFEWSSYQAYAGYGKKPAWLETGPLLERAAEEPGKRTEAYRELVEERIRQGIEESPWKKLRWGVVLGSERFARKVRGKVKIDRETSGQRELRKRWAFDEIVRKVERIKKERWPEFRDRHGDWGRDLALWAGRKYCGMTLKELGEAAGGIDYTTVVLAIQRLAAKSGNSRDIRSAMRRVDRECNL